ncbi:MAG: hypothetical protein EOM66_10820, partial [Clostridia bacterium]|nr:hypothetical protein [Clostridia bacterium]
GIGTALDEPNSVCREINITGGTLMAAGGNNITLQDHTKVSADVGGYAVSGWNSGRNVTPVYFSGGNLMLANQGSGVFRFEPRCDQTTTVYLNKLTLENYGDKISGGSHRLTELKAERSGAPYSSYGLNDVYLFSSAPELWLWLPDATTADAVTLSAPLTNRGDTYFSGKTTAKVGGTLYPKTNLILTAENPAVVEKEGSAFVSMNSGTAQEIVPPVLKHRTITDYHPLGSLPIMNRDGALYASQSPYTDASARWTGFGQSLYSNGLSLYAHSQPFQYNVAFDANKPSGASTAMSGSMGPLSMTYDVETQLTANGYALPGYQFTGWNTAADGQGTGYANQAKVKNLSEENGATVTLYAQWRAYSYQVHFDPNGGSGSMQAQQFTFDLPQKLTKNAFTVNQEHFVGWATNAFGKLYEDEEIVCNLCTLDSNGYPTGATLYAEWMSGGNATVWVTLNDEAYSNLTVELCEQTPGNPIRYRLPETAKGCYTAASGGALGIPAGT